MQESCTHLSKFVEDLFAHCNDFINPGNIHLQSPYFSNSIHSLDRLDSLIQRVFVEINNDNMHPYSSIFQCFG